jgi:hypothetical protein
LHSLKESGGLAILCKISYKTISPAKQWQTDILSLEAFSKAFWIPDSLATVTGNTKRFGRGCRSGSSLDDFVTPDLESVCQIRTKGQKMKKTCTF